MTETDAQASWRANAPKKIVAVKLVCKSDKGNILLVKPTYKPTWQFPGGGVELGDSPVNALIREISEELGLNINEHEVKPVGITFQPKDDSVLIIYELRSDLSENSSFQLQEEELEAHQFTNPDEVPNLISDYYTDFWTEYTTRY